MILFSKKKLLIVSLCYIYIPVIVFLFGWTKLYIALGCSFILLFAVARLYHDCSSRQAEEICIGKGCLLFLLLFFFLVGYYAGWGRFTEQSSDWWKHNAVLADLVNHSWPVYYINGEEHSMLTYYLGQYIIPALAGKVLHSFRTAEFATLLWAELGLFLVYMNLIRIFQVRVWYMRLLTAGLLCFFNGPLLLGQKIAGMVYPELDSMTSNRQWFIWQDDVLLQYSNHFVLLRWVFPQVLVIWLCFLFFYEHKCMVQHYMTVLLPGIFFGVLPFVGVLPFAVGYAFFMLYQERSIKRWIRQVFSLQNVMSFLSFGIVMLLYFYGNVLSEKPDVIRFRMVEYGGEFGEYIIFIFFMVLLYGMCIFRDNRGNVFFYIAVASLILIPLFRMGRFNDWVMRCSIPALFVNFMLIIKFLNDHLAEVQLRIKRKKGGVDLRVAVLSALMCIGLISPLQELYEVFSLDALTELGNEMMGTMEDYSNRKIPELQGKEDLVYNYYSYDIENNAFYKYVARKWIE